MANQSASRLAGDDYQHLYAWKELLDLLIPGFHLLDVTVEDPDAVFVDDVTKRYEPEAAGADQFIQLKYHVDHRGQYSTDAFLEAKGKGRSLLRKFYETWAVRGRRSPAGTGRGLVAQEAQKPAPPG